MIGTTQKAHVVGKSFSKFDPTLENGVFVELPGNVKGHLHISRMLGKTAEERAATLASLINTINTGTEVEVDVVAETMILEEPGFRVDQWSCVRRARKQTAEAWLAAQTVLKGEVEHVGESFAIVNLPDEMQGLLHISRLVGDSDEERAERLSGLTHGSPVHVLVSEVIESQGRLRVRLGQIAA